MGRPLDQSELRRRAIAGVGAEVEAFGSAAPDSLVVRREGLRAAVVPASPQRSLFNSVYYEDPAALVAELDALEALYESHGVRAWTVWVPDDDRETARLLGARGHTLDAGPRAMAMELEEFEAAPPAPAGGNVADCPVQGVRLHGLAGLGEQLLGQAHRGTPRCRRL